MTIPCVKSIKIVLRCFVYMLEMLVSNGRVKRVLLYGIFLVYLSVLCFRNMLNFFLFFSVFYW